MDSEINPMEQPVAAEKKNLEITGDINKYLDSASKWSKFLAILGFVFIGIMVVAGFIMSIAMSFLPFGQNNFFPFPPFLFGLIYLVIAAIYLLPLLYLFRFSTYIQRALATGNQNLLASAFKNLKAHYKFIAIFIIVMFCLYIVMMFVMVFVGFFTEMTSGISNMNV